MVIAIFFLAGALALVAAWLVGTWLANAGFPIPDEGRRIGCIDGLRGYLALLVAISHFVMWVRLLGMGIPWGEGEAAFITVGQGPVAIFFMITGMLFYPKVRDGFGKVSWRNLLFSRIFRIYPAAIISISLMTVGIWFSAGLPTSQEILIDTGENLLNWVFFVSEPPLFGVAETSLANAGVFWTLRAEWQFYLWVLPIFAILRSITPWLPRYFSPILMVLIYISFKIGVPGPASFIPHFMIGMIIFEVSQNEKLAALFRSNLVSAGSMLILIFAVMFLETPTTGRTALFYAPFLACVVCGSSYFGIFSHRGALVLGEASYGIYVFHGFILWVSANFARPLIVSHPALIAAALPAVIAAISMFAALVYVKLEAPMIRKGRALSRSRSAAVSPA